MTDHDKGITCLSILKDTDNQVLAWISIIILSMKLQIKVNPMCDTNNSHIVANRIHCVS